MGNFGLFGIKHKNWFQKFTEFLWSATVNLQNIKISGSYFRKLWCASVVYASPCSPHALCSQRFWQSLRSRTQYMCESSIYPWFMCVMLLQPPPHGDHYTNCWHGTSCSYCIIIHWRLADLCFTISPSNLNWIVNCFPLFRHTARTILRNKHILHKMRSHMMNFVKRLSEQVFHITENNLAVSNHWMTLHCLLTCETRCTRPNCNNL